MKPNILKYISALLVVALVFSFAVPTPKAEAVVLEGYAAYALAGALVSVLAAAGVSFLSSNGNAEKLGSDIIDSFDTFLEQSASAPAGTGVSSYRDDIASSISTSQDGSSFVVDSDTMALMDAYTGWFVDQYGLSSNSVQLFSSSYCGDILLGYHYTSSQSFTFQNSYEVVFSHGVTLTSDGTATIDNTYGSFTPYYSYGNFVTSYSFSVVDGRFKCHLHLSDGNTDTYSYPEYGIIILSTSSVSASYSANSDYGFDGTGATVGDSDYSLSVVNGGNGSNPQQDPDADAATNLATTALTLALIGDLVSQLTEHESASEPSSGSEVQTQFYSEVRLFFQNFWDNLTEALGNGLEAIETLLGNIATAISNAATSVVSGISSAIDSIGDKIDDWKEDWSERNPSIPAIAIPTGFSSIWHYVAEWLSYIGGFITLVLSVWSALPYGIVVPVYACVTLILIFGIYRKFIA